MSNESTIDILYEDDDIAAIDKPARLMVHADGRSKGPFLTDWIVKHFPDAVNVGEPARSQDGTGLERSGIVHRLDSETSGVMLIAKTAKGFECLKKQFQDKTILKKYLVFVWGEIDEEFGTISRPIGRSGGDFRKWSAQRGARGAMRPAETYWTRKWTGKPADDSPLSHIKESARNSSREMSVKNEKFSLVEAEPKTGRTHQIRVHMNAINHPVVGDSLYAPKRPPALGFSRMALHSRSIEFENTEGKQVKVIAPLPEDFAHACTELGIVVK